MAEKMNRDIIIVHTSDLHVDHDYTARLHGGDGTAGLACVLQASRSIGADVVLLVGDTFDSHRVPDHVLDRAAAVISDSGLPVVLLPGNHDPAIAEAIYRRGMLAQVGNLHVFGVRHDQSIEFPELGLEVWGRPHLDYGDMVPFEIVRARRTRWQVAVAHGHYDPQADRSISPRASWLINDEELIATGADYVALGHAVLEFRRGKRDNCPGQNWRPQRWKKVSEFECSPFRIANDLCSPQLSRPCLARLSRRAGRMKLRISTKAAPSPSWSDTRPERVSICIAACSHGIWDAIFRAILTSSYRTWWGRAALWRRTGSPTLLPGTAPC